MTDVSISAPACAVTLRTGAERQARSWAASRPARIDRISVPMAAAFVALCAAAALPALSSTGGRLAAPRAPVSRSTPATHGVSMPVTFVPNVGQDSAAAPFIARVSAGVTMALSATRTTITVGSGANQSQLSLDLVGARSDATIAGLDKQVGIANYFTGRDPSQWHTKLPMFDRVVTDNAYPGISLVWRSTDAGAEYEFDVAPGADPSAIAWRVAGATSLRIDAEGALIIGTRSGPITENAPQAFQAAGGIRQSVPSRFVVRGDEVQFAVGTYDHSRPLVIDPTLTFSTYLPGDGYAVRLDAQGNVYVLGNGSVSKFGPTGTLLYTSTVAAAGPPSTSLTQQWHGLAVDSAGDAFLVSGGNPITELDPSGSQVLYSASLPGASLTAVALGPAGTVYVTGSSTGGLPTTPGAFQTSSTPAGTVTATGFIAKIDPSLTGDGTGTLSTTNPQLVYSTYTGSIFLGNYSGQPFPDIAVDGQGNAYVSGSTSDASYPVTPGAFSGPPAGGFTGPADSNPSAVFVSELSPSGHGSADLVYSTLLDGSTANPSSSRPWAVDAAFALALGPSVAAGGPATIDVVGATGSADFPVTATAFQRTASTCNVDSVDCDAFYARINPVGGGASDLLYSTYLGGSLQEDAYDVTTDAAGHAFLTGYAWSPDFPVTGNAVQPAKCCPTSPYEDVFVSEMDPTAAGSSGLVFSTYLGGSGDDRGDGVAINGSGNLIVTGYTNSPGSKAVLRHLHIKPVDFPVTTGRKQTVLGSGFLTIISGL